MVQVQGRVIRKGKALDGLLREFSGITGLKAVISMGEASAYAVHHEFGAPAANIPARPFIRPTFEENRDRYLGSMKWSIARVLHGSRKLEGELDRIGRIVADDIKMRIASTDSPANAEATIRKKGFDDPLIDSHTMVDAVTVKIVKM